MAIKMEHKPMTRGDKIRAQVADNQGVARFIIRVRSPHEPRFVPACPECYADMMWLHRPADHRLPVARPQDGDRKRVG